MNRDRNTQHKDFITAYDELGDSLFRHSFFRVSNREVAIDMVQDTFIKTWQHIERGEEIQNLKAYLYHVMNNLIIDYYRKSKSGSLEALLDDGFDPRDETVDIERKAEISLVISSLDGLSDEDRKLIVFRHVDGLSILEIAEALDESENVISVRLHRAIKKLKEIIKP
jgi:RNA polymerase sigma-70 factor (ECF subfamily)